MNEENKVELDTDDVQEESIRSVARTKTRTREGI